MSYQVRFTDTTKTPITVEDQTLNAEKSVTFVGKNYAGYSQYIAENFLHLLENFAKSSSPSSPVTGQLWFDTTTGINNQLKVYNGTNWVAAGSVRKSTTAPLTSVIGDLWVDTDNQQLYLYNGSGWILVGPQYSTGQKTGAEVELITDITEQVRAVLTLFVDDDRVAIISAIDFTPKSALSGFPAINQGINISATNFNSSATGNKLWGTAEKANALVVGTAAVAAANFLRKDEASTTNFAFSIRNNTGLSIGGDLALNIAIEGNAAVISNKISGSSIDFKVKGTSNDPIIRIDSTATVGINRTNPSEALDVNGNIRSNSKIFVTGTEESSNLSTGSIQTAGGLSVAKLIRAGGGLNVTSTSSLENVNPKTDSTYDLGTDINRWKTIYADDIVASNFTGNFSGFLTGNISGTATGLVATTSFSLGDRLDGSGNILQASDVVSTAVNFNGSTATGSVILTGVISSSFIANKIEATDSFITDELLINRSGALRRLSKDTFLANVATVPTGTILPFAGTIVPTGYLLCDGSEYSISSYPDLFGVIGYNYKSLSLLVGSGTFAIPDLRGRFPLGMDSMGGTSADRVTDVAADSIGGQGGASEVSLTRNNLPEHVHDLKGESGSQFYAFAPRTGTPPDGNAESANGLTAVGQGQLMVDSGGIFTDDLASGTLNVPVEIQNPYLTINYIIFTGRIA